ncbi:hypothetical protein BU24DRAFT_417079 [Aaosphaeria arxii CBS 175.79]|uniref:Uncharacterized protein n=1 Tax=Aaosphaeria arxii CBS 175.79 TaxID=1450172 RepID=A0A6A5Y7Y6_9PLEO|nr:uncharacterized protein BU24DRAFT_417079 [Aaosphaeria arxii CBS 175.79]KAF2021416.1 hypothetical protein BU24DRAFT_417079 [Aaosphaeria arxii CBS 175.79]
MASSSIDYLFQEDLFNSTMMEPTFPFESLPAELRNMVYEYYFATPDMVTSPSGLKTPIAFTINSQGNVEMPSISQISFQSYKETKQLVRHAVQREHSSIIVKVSSQNIGPQMLRIYNIAKEFNVVPFDMLKRVIIRHEEKANMEILWPAIEQYIHMLICPPGGLNPFMFQVADGDDLPTVDGYGKISLYNGVFDLGRFAKYYAYCKHPRCAGSWDWAAATFLNNLGELGYEQAKGVAAEKIFNTIFDCYTLVLELDGLAKQSPQKVAGAYRQTIFDLVQVVEAFSHDLVGVVGLRHAYF